MRKHLNNFETFLFVALLLALCVALAFGWGTTVFGRIPLPALFFYALFGSLLMVSRYRSHGNKAHTSSIMILLLPFPLIPFLIALFEAQPVVFPSFFKNVIIYAPLVLIPMKVWSGHMLRSGGKD
jgi:hypothetical protein